MTNNHCMAVAKRACEAGCGGRSSHVSQDDKLQGLTTVCSF